MKKTIAFIINVAIVFSPFNVIASVAISSDIEGTKYENAVTVLTEKNILSGYSDGTYRPDNPVSRAEMATIIIKTVAKTNYENVAEVSFSDTKGHWAESYITLAYSLDAIKGRSNTTFDPDGQVMHVEAAAMLLRLMGYKDDSLEGKWPSNYLEKAKELGLLEDIETNERGSTIATRGDVALMVSVVVQTIRDQWAEETTTTEPAIDIPNNGKLNDYSGRVIGIPLGISTVLTSSGSIVDEVEYMMNGIVYKLRTAKKGVISAATFTPYTGDLYVARMLGGVVKGLEIASPLNISRCIELTKDSLDVGIFSEVTQNKNNRLSVSGGAISEFNYADEVICYETVFDGDNLESFDTVAASHIDVGDYIRAWDLDEDWAGIAIVMILIDENDIVKAQHYGII